MAVKHKSYLIPAFPVYSAGFVSDNELVLGGGGGSSRAGIKNKLVGCQLLRYVKLGLTFYFRNYTSWMNTRLDMSL